MSCIAALLWATAAFPQQDDRAAWKTFLEWYKTYQGSPYPPEVMKAYSSVLKSSGLTDADVKLHLGAFQKIAAESPREMLSIHFNKIYTQHPEVFSQAPNGFLTRMVRDMKPGKALECGMGQGRNSVFLAAQGWDVTGYDISDQGMAIARANAEKAGKTIKTVLASHDDFDFGKEQWDLIVLTYSFANMSDAGFLSRLRDSLKPGGIVLVEQLNSGGTGKGPANALFGSFKDLRVIHYEDAVGTAEWSGNKARIGRIVAQKD